MNLNEYEIMYQVEDRHWWYLALRGMLDHYWRKHVLVSRPMVLDVGCGTGATLQWLARREEEGERRKAKGERETGNWKLETLLPSSLIPHPSSFIPHPSSLAFGIDFSTEAVQFCRTRELACTAVASALALPFLPETFDVAVLCDLLYHRAIPDKRAPLHQTHAVLKPNGLVFINVPAYQWLYSSHDVAVHTDRRFTKREVLHLLRACSFEPLDATYWNTLLFPPILLTRAWRRFFPPKESDLAGFHEGLSNRLFSQVLAIERQLIRLAPMPFGLSIFVVARKR